jgi:NAD(P)-dependent dehydrogenase (short-subunit alcohol dehydrogenase family)
MDRSAVLRSALRFNIGDMMATSKKAVVVIGAGDATGGAIARRFAREGYIACVTRRHPEKLTPLVEQIRSEGGEVYAFGSDARKEEAMVSLFQEIEANIAPVEAAIFNIGANVKFDITDTTARVYQKVWEMACFAGFLMGREAAKVMLPRERGSIFFTGATASLRGRAGYAAFSGAKHALRALAQSMAKELAPKGLHVAQLIVDGAIDTEFIRESFPDRYKLKEVDGIVNPEHIADTYWMLHQQPRDAWTHELDIRPWMEGW